ncbi:hypothetical protein [Acinetobacter sp. RW6]|uniref:hypothetical protein n=1 Tax=Acinetobacter sp. RW6 TaxID=3242680 RepID=UPI0035BFADC8
MIDSILKLLPFFLAIAPLFVWLDKSKRFTHRRKFFSKRVEEIKNYVNKYYQKELSEIEKDCAAQLLVGSDKVGHYEVDYIIEHYPQRFFTVIEEVITARKFIRVELIEDTPNLVTNFTKKQLIKINVILAIMYFLSLGILYINDVFVYILTWLPYVNPIQVDATVYSIGFLFLLALFIICISVIWFFFWSADSALKIYEKLNVKYISKTSS